MQEFIELIEEAYQTDNNTRCILFAPDRYNADWCQALKRNTLFRLIEIYPTECPIFSGFSPARPLVRTIYSKNLESILVFEVNKHPLHKRSISFEQLLRPNCPVVAEMKRLGYIREHI